MQLASIIFNSNWFNTFELCTCIIEGKSIIAAVPAVKIYFLSTKPHGCTYMDI